MKNEHDFNRDKQKQWSVSTKTKQVPRTKQTGKQENKIGRSRNQFFVFQAPFTTIKTYHFL